MSSFKYYVGEPRLSGGKVFWPIMKEWSSDLSVEGVSTKDHAVVHDFHELKCSAMDAVDRLNDDH